MGLDITVSEKSQVASVITEIDKIIKKQSSVKETVTASILCDALLNHLLLEGFTDIKVRVNDDHPRYIDIRANGAQAALETITTVSEEECIEDEINISILNQYIKNILIQYKTGINHFKIYTEKKTYDLNGEIFEFYNKADSGQKIPLSILKYLISRHRMLFFLSVFNMSVKHLGALMLPVFSANIIDLVVKGNSFFSLDIWRCGQNLGPTKGLGGRYVFIRRKDSRHKVLH